ncbi:MAG: carbohydrate ABC transporter permease [Chloroflexota bacterium]
MSNLPTHSLDRRNDGVGPVRAHGASRPAKALREFCGKAPAYLPLLIWAIPTLLGFYFVIITSLKTNQEIFQGAWALPKRPVFENYVRAWDTAHVGHYFSNSLLVTIGSVALTAVTASLAAYVLARFQFPGNRISYMLFLAGLMIPICLTLVPLYELAAKLHMANSLLGLIVISSVFTLPFSVFVLTSFFRSLPSELADAALVDGCGELGVFWRIMLPLGAPGVITTSIFNALYVWNDYLLPLILIVSSNRRTLPLGVMGLSGAAGSSMDWAALYAGLVLLIAPSLVTYLLLQSRIESSITLGALK